MEGLQFWQEAFGAGRGVVLVTGHLGNWELLAAWISALGAKLHVLYHPFSEGRLDRLVRKRRAACGVSGLAAEQDAQVILKIREDAI